MFMHERNVKRIELPLMSENPQIFFVSSLSSSHINESIHTRCHPKDTGVILNGTTPTPNFVKTGQRLRKLK